MPLGTFASTQPQIFFEFNDAIYKKMVRPDNSGEETNYPYGKARENAGRIALILAFSRNGTDATITAASSQTALTSRPIIPNSAAVLGIRLL